MFNLSVYLLYLHISIILYLYRDRDTNIYVSIYLKEIYISHSYISVSGD